MDHSETKFAFILSTGFIQNNNVTLTIVSSTVLLKSQTIPVTVTISKTTLKQAGVSVFLLSYEQVRVSSGYLLVSRQKTFSDKRIFKISCLQTEPMQIRCQSIGFHVSAVNQRGDLCCHHCKTDCT